MEEPICAAETHVPKTCECKDPGCPYCCGTGCEDEAEAIAYRVDMYDRTGFQVCRGCLNDVADSMLFHIEPMDLGDDG